MYGQALPRYFRGVYDDVKTLPHPERLEARTRAFARIGGLFSDRADEQRSEARKVKWPNVSSRSSTMSMSSSRRARRSGPSRIGAYQRRGAISTLTLVAAAGAVSGDVQRDGPAGGGRAVGLGRQRPADVDPVGGQAVRRGDVAVAGARRSSRRGRGRSAARRCPNSPRAGRTSPRARCLHATRRPIVAFCARSRG